MDPDVDCKAVTLVLFLHQVLVASAHAHATIGKYGANLTSTSPAPLQRLLDWKVKRGREDLSVEEYYSPAWFKCAIV